MSERATSRHLDPGRRGSALAATLVTFAVVAGLALAATQLSSVEAAAARRSINDVRATAAAEAGVERSKALLAEAARKMNVQDPLQGVRAIFDAGSGAAAPFIAEPILQDGKSVAEFTTSMTLRQDREDELIVTFTSTGYIPCAPQHLAPMETLDASESIEVTVRYSVGSSAAFDSAYFVNNWGWLQSDSLEIHGNVRSNGPLNIGGQQPTIDGQPLFDSVTYSEAGATLGDRRGEEGLFSGWGIHGANQVTNGRGGAPDKHSFQGQIEMPNLADLTRYEELATAAASSITIGDRVVCDGITGNGTDESANLYLHGTEAQPIVLNGPIVVRGDLMISGYVTGRGALYSAGNVFIPDSVRYVDGPTSQRPESCSRGDIEAWLSANRGADFLGLFAGENVVVGDFTDGYYDRVVGDWLGSSMNSSVEDAGMDRLIGTRAGRDGVLGTADDDILEGDGHFSVEHYSALDRENGLIPDGYSVGDVIPGSGEDIDGDGQFDAALTMADLSFEDPLTEAHWDGNIPEGGVADYSSIASLFATRLDASIYTNHAFAWVTVGDQDAELNGSLAIRNECMLYGTPRLRLSYDARLLRGGVDGGNDLLPQCLQPIEVLQWRHLEEDPHLSTMP